MKEVLKQLFSGENGFLSSKRVSGILILLVVMGCIIYLTISEGGTQTVENLLTTAMILATSLLGISSITSIWKKPPSNITNNILYQNDNSCEMTSKCENKK